MTTICNFLHLRFNVFFDLVVIKIYIKVANYVKYQYIQTTVGLIFVKIIFLQKILSI